MDKVNCVFSAAAGISAGAVNAGRGASTIPSCFEIVFTVLIAIGFLLLILFFVRLLFHDLRCLPWQGGEYYKCYLDGIRDVLRCKYPKCDSKSFSGRRGYIDGYEKHLKHRFECGTERFGYAFFECIRTELYKRYRKNLIKNAKGSRCELKATIVNYGRGKMLLNLNIKMPGYDHKISIDLVFFEGIADISLFFRDAGSDWIDIGMDSGFNCWMKSISELSKVLEGKDFTNEYIDYSTDKVNGINEQIGKRVRVSPLCLPEGDDADVFAGFLYELIGAVVVAGSDDGEIENGSSVK